MHSIEEGAGKTHMKFEKEHRFVLSLLDGIDTIIEENKVLNVVTKSNHRDLVTVVDKAIEDYLMEQISKNFPDDAMLGEEHYDPSPTLPDQSPKAKMADLRRLWVLDPIDGTTNFVKQADNYCTLIAFFDKGVPYLSYIFLPPTGELFYAIRGQGAFHRTWAGLATEEDYKKLSDRPFTEEKLLPVEDMDLRESLISFDLRRLYRYYPGFVDHLITEAFEIRRQGSSGVDGVKVIRGHYKAFMSYSGGPWDFAPHFLFAEELGLVLCQLDGSPLDLDSYHNFFFGTPKVFTDISQAYKTEVERCTP